MLKQFLSPTGSVATGPMPTGPYTLTVSVNGQKSSQRVVRE